MPKRMATQDQSAKERQIKMDITAKEYFLSRRPEAGEERAMYNRVITSLARLELTMQGLLELSEKDLKRVRGVGAGSRAIIKSECENYRNTTQSILGGTPK